MLTDDQKMELDFTLEAEMIEGCSLLYNHGELLEHTQSRDINELVANDHLKALVIDMLIESEALDNLVGDILGMAQHRLVQELKNV